MGTIFQNSQVQTTAACHASQAERTTTKTAPLDRSGSHNVVNSADAPTAEYAKRNKRTALAVAVGNVLSVSTQHRYGYLLAATLMSSSSLVQAQGFPSSINLPDLSGSDGFALNGAAAGDRAGASVSDAGDINGDGVDDLIIGAPGASPGGNGGAGSSYVVFGGNGVGSTGLINLSGLSGADGFVLNGVDARDFSGTSVSAAGDINGDGVDDLIIGAPADPPRTGKSAPGRSYVVFGSSGVGSTGVINLSDLSGSDGFVLNGIDDFDLSGTSVSGAGDINGDGVDDLIIGAYYAAANGIDYAGETYVVFGGSGVGGTGAINLSDLSGNDGFVLNGVGRRDRAGISVSGAGDINGDGVDDLIIGADGAPKIGPRNAGETYVVFGDSGIGSSGVFNLFSLNGSNGFVLRGVNFQDYSGGSVSGAGDINGDGVDDLIIGAAVADIGDKGRIGKSYVVFGGSGVGSAGAIDLPDLNGSDGFVLNGVNAEDRSGSSVSGAGDINSDGVDDLIIGAQASASYVVFGGSGVGGTGVINLSDLNGTNGVVLKGTSVAVSDAGDINNDGVADVIIGTPFAGVSYVLFGKSASAPPPGSGPDNDQFADAENIDGISQALISGTTLKVNGNTVEATAQNGEPAHFQGGFGLPSGPRNSIWYRWTAEADQLVEIDTAGSEVGTVVVAYTGTTVSELQQVARGIDTLREVARIRFAVRAGETYHLAVDGYDNNSEGEIQLNIRQPTMDPSECTITGTNGQDVLTGTSGPDVICGLDGNDVIKSLGGADIIFAGKGFDFISAGSGNDIVFGDDGNDVLVGGSGNDVLVGGARADKLYGGSGDDSVFGGAGADRLFGSSGNDDLFGEMGGDRLFGGEGDDNLDGGPFNNTCLDSAGDDTFVNC